MNVRNFMLIVVGGLVLCLASCNNSQNSENRRAPEENELHHADSERLKAFCMDVEIGMLDDFPMALDSAEQAWKESKILFVPSTVFTDSRYPKFELYPANRIKGLMAVLAVENVDLAETDIADVRYLFVINPEDASFPHETTNSKDGSTIPGFVAGKVYAYDIFTDQYIGELPLDVSNEKALSDGNYTGLSSADDLEGMSPDELSHDLAEKVKHSIFNQLRVAV